MSTELNPRVAMMRPSKTMAVSARARALRREGKPIIALSAGEPDFPTPTSIAEAGIQAIRDGHTTYTDVAGIVQLRERISEKLRRDNGVAYSAEEILCCNGAKQAVAQAILALVRPGDEVVIPAPYWVSYPDMTVLAGGTPKVLQTSAQSNYRIGAEELRSELNDDSRILILCSPSNPTGSVYPKEELEAIAEVVRDFPNLFVLSDEIYEHIVFDIKPICFASLPGMRDQTVTVNGFSKSYAMTGCRLGYMAAPDWIVKAARKVQGQTTSAPSTISQYAGLAALDLDPEPIQEMVAAFRSRRDFMLDALAEIPDVICPKPEGAFYLFPDVSAYYGTTSPSGRAIDDDEAICLFLLEECHVALVPGGAFGDPKGVRISYAASREDLEEAMRRIAVGLASLQR
jgi:aspartate/methionine/tyrosine aminotransferase